MPIPFICVLNRISIALVCDGPFTIDCAQSSCHPTFAVSLVASLLLLLVKTRSKRYLNPRISHCINLLLPVLTLGHQKPAPKKTRGRKVIEDSDPEEEYAVQCQSHASNNYTDLLQDHNRRRPLRSRNRKLTRYIFTCFLLLTFYQKESKIPTRRRNHIRRLFWIQQQAQTIRTNPTKARCKTTTSRHAQESQYISKEGDTVPSVLT